MKNRWSNKEAAAFVKKYSDSPEEVALRVYSSRLIGADPALVLHGGGNTSVKAVIQDRMGEKIRALFVKGSGWDLDTIEPPGLPGVKLDYLQKLRALDYLSDEDMVNDQRVNLLDANSPNPSVETLLHAFLPHKFVDHSHADSILVLANQPDAKKICEKIFKGFLGIVPYIMPGFSLAKAAAQAYEKNPSVKGLVLLNHGLFTFGETARESYDYHIEAVTQAEEFIAKQPLTTYTPLASIPEQDEREILNEVAPALRGLYEKYTGTSWSVYHRPNKPALAFASSKECANWSQIGTATPDHVIRTKQKPLILKLKNLKGEKLYEEVSSALETYITNYHSYFNSNKMSKGVDKKELDPLPRVLLVAGLGLVTIGKTVKETIISADLYEHTIDIIQKSFSVGEYRPLDHDDLFDMEYWSLEQAKLNKNAPPPLQGKSIYITGAASGIGLATARLFGKQGGNLYLIDCNGDKLETAKNIIQKEGKGGVSVEVLDITNETAVGESFTKLTSTYGGLDILISNAGNALQGAIAEIDSKALRKSFDLNFFAHQTLASLSTKLFLKQKTGGVMLFNASKAAFNPGKDFGPYALPKAAVVALAKQYALEYGKYGIRSNALNADRIRTGMFSEKMIAERASARGLTADAYFKNNLLEREVLDIDVAEGFLHLALAESTTGSVITVDGGNIAASPR